MDLGATLCTRSESALRRLSRRHGVASRIETMRSHRYPAPTTAQDAAGEARAHVSAHRRRTAAACSNAAHRPDCGADFGIRRNATATIGVDELLAELGLRSSRACSSSHRLPGFRHTFTHFHLDIEPVRIDVRDSVVCGGRSRSLALVRRRRKRTAWAFRGGR